MADDNKQQALAEKDLGNQAYKKKQFDEALSHYEKAWSLDDTNISILTNKAGMCLLLWLKQGNTYTLYFTMIAVLFEQEKYDECIKTCEEAIEVGRSVHADYKLIAR